MFHIIKKSFLFSAFAACMMAGIAAQAYAVEHNEQKPDNINDIFGKSPNYLGFALGIYDMFDDKTAGDFRIEYTSGTPLFGPFKSLIVAELTEDASFYAGAGIYIDYLPHKNIYIKPSFVIGIYGEGSGKDLGDGSIFRSQLEIGYQFDSLQRIGISFSHLSNGGQDKNNAGTETISLYYHMPIENLFSRNRNGNTRVMTRHKVMAAY